MTLVDVASTLYPEYDIKGVSSQSLSTFNNLEGEFFTSVPDAKINPNIITKVGKISSQTSPFLSLLKYLTLFKVKALKWLLNNSL